MAELLEQGPERPPRPGVRRALVAVAALVAVVAGGVAGAGAWRDRQEQGRRDDAVRVTAAVLGAQDADRYPSLLVTVGLTDSGSPGSRLRDVSVRLPGSRVGVQPPPDRFGADRQVRLSVQVTPDCPAAVDGLGRGTVSATVVPASGERHEVTTPLPALGPLGDAVRRRCGTPDPFQRLLLNDLVLRGASGAPPGRVRTLLTLRGPLRIDGLVPLPGLDLDNVTALPLVLGETGGRLVVDVGVGDCPSVPRAPTGELSPYALRVDSQQVDPLVEPDLSIGLAALVATSCP